MDHKTIDISEIKKSLEVEKGIGDFLYYHFYYQNLLETTHPSRLNVFSVSMCLNGWEDISVGLHRMILHKNELLVILPNQILQIHEVSNDFEAQAIMISNDFMSSLNINTSQVVEPYFRMEETPVIQINGEERIRMMLAFYASLNSLTGFSGQAYNKEIVQHTVYAFLFWLAAMYEELYPVGTQSFSDNENLLGRFLSLLQKHFKEERSVGFYSDKLCLTPKYLSTYIKRVSGKTAGMWISEIMILEARVLLQTPGMSVQQVADELNFPDQSTFGKFFKKQTGTTPNAYRKGSGRNP